MIHVKIPVAHDATYEVVVPCTVGPGERFQVNCGGMLGWLTVPEDFPAPDPHRFGKEPPLTMLARVKPVADAAVGQEMGGSLSVLGGAT